MSATIAPEKILKELAALWVEEGKAGDNGVLRACSMTLIVIAEEGEDAGALGETVAALMPEHPARAILVRLRSAQERALSERVYQQCWMPFGQRRQICCEQIELTASDAALGDLPSVLLPLIVADLPVMIWCRSARLAEMSDFADIARLATKVVFDTAPLRDPVDALSRMSAVSKRIRVGDLAWTRLTRKREMLAHVCENRDLLTRLSAVSEISVTHGLGSATSAWYLGAWAQNALEAFGAKPRLQVSPGADGVAIELTGPGLRVALAREQDRLVVTIDGKASCTHLPAPSDYLLLREELGFVTRDLVFEQTLSTAARLAVSSPKV